MWSEWKKHGGGEMPDELFGVSDQDINVELADGTLLNEDSWDTHWRWIEEPPINAVIAYRVWKPETVTLYMHRESDGYWIASTNRVSKDTHAITLNIEELEKL